MSGLRSRTQRQAEFLAAATKMYDQLENWYEHHPAASFGEIEMEARRARRDLMGVGLAVLINGRDTGFQLEPPACPQCGQPQHFVGYRSWRVSGLEGETDLQRAYYVCRQCEAQTLFPPRSETEVARGPLE